MRLLTKFVLAFAVFFACAFGCMVFLSFRSQRLVAKSMSEDLQQILRSVHFSSEEISAEPSADRETLSRIIEKAKSNPAVKEVTIVSSSSEEVVASSNPARVGTKFVRKRPLTGREIIVRERFGVNDSNGRHLRYEITTPIIRNHNVIGLVETSFTVNDFNDLLHRLYMRSIGFSVFAFLVLFALSYVVLYRLVRPLSRLNRAAESIASGDLSVRVDYTSSDEVGRLTANFNQMTERLFESRNLEEKLRIMDRRAVLSETAATLAHEIRNPLNLINLTADHLAHHYRPADTKQREAYEGMIASLKAEVRHLNTMVEEFMAIGKPIRIHRTTFLLGEIFAQVELLIKQQLISKQLALRYTLPQGLTVSADQEQMRLVFLNLLLNAIDASPTGETVTIAARREPLALVIQISDEGPGIDVDLIGRIFEPYVSKRPEGFGLGLAMVKRIVEAHEGSIKAENKETKGACFTIRLPTDI